MTEVLQANVFFFITSIAVIAFTLLLCIALYHVIKILKSVRSIVARIEEGSEVIAEDIAYLRQYFKEGSLISHLVGLFFGRREGRKTSPRRVSPKKGTNKSSGNTLDINEVT